MSYIGRKRDCGCVVCAIADDTQVELIAKMVAEWIRDGLIIERVSHEYVRENFTICTHGQLGLFEAPQ